MKLTRECWALLIWKTASQFCVVVFTSMKYLRFEVEDVFMQGSKPTQS
jgi:hypothetical protein